jgi:hypothetical protein
VRLCCLMPRARLLNARPILCRVSRYIFRTQQVGIYNQLPSYSSSALSRLVPITISCPRSPSYFLPPCLSTIIVFTHFHRLRLNLSQRQNLPLPNPRPTQRTLPLLPQPIANTLPAKNMTTRCDARIFKWLKTQRTFPRLLL